jgi:hypothetical protein
VVLLLSEGLRVNAWHLYADTLAGVDSKVKILLDLINIHALLLVESSHIDCVFDCYVHKFRQDKTVLHRMEKIIVLGVKREELLDFLISVEEFVSKLGEAHLFLDKV